MRKLIAPPLDTATNLYSKLTLADASFSPTGQPMAFAYARLSSPPFSYRLPPTDNLYQTTAGVDVQGTVAPAAGDGYYSFIAGVFAPGNYVLEFGGSLPNFDGQGHTFTEAITYHITVYP